MEEFKEIYFERTMCFGTCPAYILKIHSDGRVQYFGEHFVSRRINLEFKIDEKKIKNLNDTIKKYNYFGIEKKEATDSATCHPSTLTSILMKDGKLRSIEHDHGEDSYPDELSDFEDEIDKILQIEEKFLGFQTYIYLFVEDSNSEIKDFHLVSAINKSDAQIMLEETIYQNEGYKVDKWKIYFVGSSTYDEPFILTSFLKNFPEGKKGFNFNKGKRVEKFGLVYLVKEKKARYMDLNFDHFLVYGKSEEDVIQRIEELYPNRKKEYDCNLVSLRLEDVENDEIFFEILEFEKNFPNEVIFSRFATEYKTKDYWYQKANFESPFEVELEE